MMTEAECTAQIVAQIVAAREAAGSARLDEYAVYLAEVRSMMAADPDADPPVWPDVRDALPRSTRTIQGSSRPICRTRGCQATATGTGYCSCCEHDRR